ncbi:hypothetical protein [Thiorhodovibrio winogradskyi]|nr:hypothetical protein [Thiorhodovibrio winogradskyi]
MIRLGSILLVLALLTATIAACTGPAAKQASKQAGATESRIARCESRSCFMGLLEYGGQILLDKQHPDGSFEEIYQVRRKKGSNVRSFTHGILSIATLGIWNLVGSPIEGFISSADFIVFRVIYDPHGQPTKIEIQGG